jgi:hypothetical protein
MKRTQVLGHCPTDPEHGKLIATGEGRYSCIHAEHNRREHDDEPDRRRTSWGIDELRQLGVMP